MVLCSFIHNVYRQRPELLKYKAEFESLGLKEYDIAVLHNVFVHMLTDSPEHLQIPIMLSRMNIEPSPVSFRVFTAWKNLTNQVDFREFVLGVWNICTLSPHALVYFSFDLLTRYRDEIRRNDVNSFIYELYGNQLQDKQTFERVYKMVGLCPLHEMLPDEFYQFCIRHKTFISPVIIIQQKMRKQCGGNMRWQRLSKFRMSREGGRRVATVNEIFSCHISMEQDAFSEAHMDKTSHGVLNYSPQLTRKFQPPRSCGIAISCHSPVITISKAPAVTSDMLHLAVRAAANSRLDSTHCKPYPLEKSLESNSSSPCFRLPPLPNTASKSSISRETLSSRESRVVHLSSKEPHQSEVCLTILNMKQNIAFDRNNRENTLSDQYLYAASNVSSLTDFSFNGSHNESFQGSVPSSSPSRSIIQISKLPRMKSIPMDPGYASNSPGSILRLRRIKIAPLRNDDCGV